MPVREQALEAMDDGRSAPVVRAEGCVDLGYRGVLPRALGRCLATASNAGQGSSSGEAAEGGGDSDEEYATAREIADAEAEVQKSSRRLRVCGGRSM